MLMSLLFDFADGLAARLLHTQSEIGKELDSLADAVSFGASPALILFNFADYLGYNFPVVGESISFSITLVSTLLIALFASLRLAKFNLDSNQSENFIGLPTPAMAAFILSIPLVYEHGNPSLRPFLSNDVFIVLISVFTSLLMVSKIKMFSLKFKTLKFDENKVRYGFILLSILYLAIFSFLGIMFSFVTYLLLSLIFQKRIV